MQFKFKTHIENSNNSSNGNSDDNSDDNNDDTRNTKQMGDTDSENENEYTKVVVDQNILLQIVIGFFHP